MTRCIVGARRAGSLRSVRAGVLLCFRCHWKVPTNTEKAESKRRTPPRAFPLGLVGVPPLVDGGPTPGAGGVARQAAGGLERRALGVLPRVGQRPTRGPSRTRSVAGTREASRRTGHARRRTCPGPHGTHARGSPGPGPRAFISARRWRSPFTTGSPSRRTSFHHGVDPSAGCVNRRVGSRAVLAPARPSGPTFGEGGVSLFCWHPSATWGYGGLGGCRAHFIGHGGGLARWRLAAGYFVRL
jgi:hypothetical protein